MDLVFPCVHPFQDVIRCSRYDITYPLLTVIMRNQISLDRLRNEFIVSGKLKTSGKKTHLLKLKL